MTESARLAVQLDQLQSLIYEAGIESGEIPSEMWLTRWMVIGVAVDPASPSESSCYFRLYPNGGMAPHESIGLLDVSLGFLRDELVSVEEDEDG